MRPEEFGPFLSEQRKNKNMTQTEFAEVLHVSTAAVSKWERGKCLPEVSKLEDIAQVLSISVLEVMQCRVSQEPVAAEAVKETYAETANLSKAQYQKRMLKWIAGLMIAAAAVGIVIGLHYFPVWRVAKVWWPSYFTTGEISQLAYIGTPEDRVIAKEVLAEAEKAFCDISTPYEEKEEKFGKLSRYATEAERGAVSESHTLELWSADFRLTDGTMWVYYSQEAYDENGETICGSWRIPSLWYLEKNAAGEWEVVAIKEHP
ncbi:MAG: helix-turn-helix transcriptional regulator [Oscillospiraceae bacterium]|nr:helix-turn-helix transcriptional regulator [Oscillospiraceae bacterium]